MPLYTMIYTTCFILISYDKFRKGQVKSMNMEREFSVFENDMDYRKRKRFQSLNADEWRTFFTDRKKKFRF